MQRGLDRTLPSTAAQGYRSSERCGVPIRNVIGKGGQEIRGGVVRLDESLGSRILRLEAHQIAINLSKAMLRDWRLPRVPVATENLIRPPWLVIPAEASVSRLVATPNSNRG